MAGYLHKNSILGVKTNTHYLENRSSLHHNDHIMRFLKDGCGIRFDLRGSPFFFLAERKPYRPLTTPITSFPQEPVLIYSDITEVMQVKQNQWRRADLHRYKHLQKIKHVEDLQTSQLFREGLRKCLCRNQTVIKFECASREIVFLFWFKV